MQKLQQAEEALQQAWQADVDRPWLDHTHYYSHAYREAWYAWCVALWTIKIEEEGE